MDNKPEVLVHISASTTRANDDLFRCLADAYLDFEPCNEQRGVEGHDDFSQSASTQRHSFSDLELLPQSTNVWSGCDNPNLNDECESSRPMAPSFDSYGSFPSHITSGDHTRLEKSELQESPTSPEDASLSRLGRLERIHAMWRRQHLPTSSLRGSRGQDENLELLAEESTFIENTQEALNAIESQLPDHLSTTSEEPSEGGADLDNDSVHSEPAAESRPITSQPGPISSSQANVNTSFQSAITDYSGPISASQQSLPASSSQGKVFSESIGEEQDVLEIEFTSLPSMVLPPPPKISMESPDTLPTQMTKYLALLKTQNPGRFKPKSISRSLEKDERGHWIVDCRAWPENMQYRFWSSLQRDVGNGNFGWGVTLHREAENSRELGIVRLFCWGEIVEHLWLSLWLSSKGRIIGTRAIWVDGDEQEVIAML